MTLLIAVVVLTLGISGLCSLFEATLYSTRMAALEAARADGKNVREANRLIRMKKDIAVPTSAILILNTIANTGGAMVTGVLAERSLGVAMVPLFSIAMTASILTISEIMPKTYGAVHWKSLWHLIVWPLSWMQRALYPLIVVTQKLAGMVTGGKSMSGITEDEIVAMIGIGAKSGELSRSELDLLKSVFRFDELLCRQVMVPRREVDYLDADWSLQQAVEIMHKTQHTRYPLCRGSLDKLVGLIHIKDLVGLSADSSISLESKARPINRIPETLPLSKLLTEMQKTRQHMAIVVDEFGTSVGLITLENVLEQIVGTVQDEFDREAPEVERISESEYIVLGHLPLERVNLQFKLELYATNVDTLSGLVVSKLGRLPKQGDRVELEGAIVEVLDASGSRATRVKVTLLRGGRAEDAGGDAISDDDEPGPP